MISLMIYISVYGFCDMANDLSNHQVDQLQLFDPSSKVKFISRCGFLWWSKMESVVFLPSDQNITNIKTPIFFFKTLLRLFRIIPWIYLQRSAYKHFFRSNLRFSRNFSPVSPFIVNMSWICYKLSMFYGPLCHYNNKLYTLFWIGISSFEKLIFI